MHCTIHNLWGSSVEAILYPHWSSVDVQSFISFLLLLNHCAIVLCTSCAGCTGVTGVADAASWTVLERERISSIHTWVGVKLFNLCRVLQFQLLLLLCSEVLKAGCFLKHLQQDKTKKPLLPHLLTQGALLNEKWGDCRKFQALSGCYPFSRFSRSTLMTSSLRPRKYTGFHIFQRKSQLWRILKGKHYGGIPKQLDWHTLRKKLASTGRNQVNHKGESNNGNFTSNK